MAIKLNANYLNDFVSAEELNAINAEVAAAHKTLKERSGEGSDFLGWETLPTDYDKEEFARIKIAAEKKATKAAAAKAEESAK